MRLGGVLAGQATFPEQPTTVLLQVVDQRASLHVRVARAELGVELGRTPRGPRDSSVWVRQAASGALDVQATSFGATNSDLSRLGRSGGSSLRKHVGAARCRRCRRWRS